MQNKITTKIITLLIISIAAALTFQHANAVQTDQSETPEEITLPQPATQSEMSVAQALATRRSQRRFTNEPLSIENVSQLCWAAQGITNDRGYRTSPSAGAIYPITIYIVDQDGAYEYIPDDHTLIQIQQGDLRPRLQTAAYNQSSVGSAALSMIIVMDVEKTAQRYGDRAERFCILEAGHIAQNVLLQATDLNLASVPIGAMHDDQFVEILNLPENLTPIYLLAIGNPAR